MNMQDTRGEREAGTVSAKKMARRKNGRNYLIAAVVLFGITYTLHAADITGLIPAFVSLVMIVFLVAGLANLIMGFIGRN